MARNENMPEDREGGTATIPTPRTPEEIVERLRALNEERERLMRQVNIPEAFRRDPTRPDPEDPNQEIITVETQLGSRPIQVPKTAQAKRQFMREVLAEMESTRQPDGGPTLKPSLEKLFLMLNALHSESYKRKHQSDSEEDKKIVEGLNDEFIARYIFHNQIFLPYETSGSVEDVKNAVSTFQTAHLNSLFDIPEFLVFLNYYEQNGEKFTNKKATDFRREMFLSLENPPEQYRWAQNLAERFWRISGRRAAQNQPGGIWDPEQPDQSKFKFQDDVVGGDFQLSRLLRFPDWLKTQVGSRPEISLMNKVSLGQRDYMSELVDSFLEKEEERINGKPNPKAGEYKRQSDGKLVLKAPEEGKPPLPQDLVYEVTTEEEDGTGKKIQKNVIKVNFLAKNPDGTLYWTNHDFAQQGVTNPMANWSLTKLFLPDKARNKLIENSGALLRNPEPEVLEGLIDEFDYLGEGRWKVKKQLAVNVLKYAKEKRDVRGRPKYSDTQIVAAINNLTGYMDEKKPQFFQPKDRIDVLKELAYYDADKGINRKLALRFGYYFLLGFLLGFTGRALKYITAEK